MSDGVFPPYKYAEPLDLETATDAELTKRVRELERLLEIVRQERDILKHILGLVTYNHVVIEA